MKKSTWIILIIVVALGLTYYFTKQDKVSVGVKRLSFKSFDASKVDNIDINGHYKVVLKKDKDTWKLQIKDGDQTRQVDASKAHVEEMLEAALKVSHAYYVSESTNKHEELGVLGDKATTITLQSQGAPVWALILGNNSSDGTRFARIPEDNSVYAVRGSFFSLLRNNINDWRDKSLWNLKEADVVSFNVERSQKSTFALSKAEKEGPWKIANSTPALPNSFRVDENALASFVRSNLNIRASGFIDENKALSAPIMYMTAKASDNKEEGLEIYSGDEHNYWIKRKDQEQIYLVGKNNFDRINKSIDQFRSLSVMNFDKNSIVRLKLAHNKSPAVLLKTNNVWALNEPKKLPDRFEFDSNTVDALVNAMANLHGERIAEPLKDKAEYANWQKSSFLEMSDAAGKTIHFYASKIKSKPFEYLVLGNIDNEIYVVKGQRLNILEKGLLAFNKEEVIIPPAGDKAHGLESLPPEIRQKVLEAAKQNMRK